MYADNVFKQDAFLAIALAEAHKDIEAAKRTLEKIEFHSHFVHAWCEIIRVEAVQQE